ncbi:hypothetical protein GIB67_036635 [Kingdonia uniflora]|uniref:Uncharacterized protein n=1 Tax=Kingdonia uniflora TaxID=39325 RepID=A0A7J7LW87_9MAGN|nr:hypothetical protein GIB67_036635 [Kingdonia uniflora]
MHLLRATPGTKDSPITVYMVHLVDLMGRAAPILIIHKKQRATAKYAASNAIVGAFKIFEAGCNHVQIHSYTSITPYNAMHHDICELALQNNATLILVPSHKKGVEGYYNVNMTNLHVLDQAPCSVGILVDRSQNHGNSPQSLGLINSVAVLFLGGADAREALAYADRMTDKPGINLTLVHFISAENEVNEETDF